MSAPTVLYDDFSTNWAKSGSAPISRILLRHLRAMTVIPLGRTLPCASSYLPAGSAGHTSTPAYLVLLQVEIARFTQTELARLCCSDPHLAVDGGYPLPCPVESGLSSTKTSSQRPSGALPFSWYHVGLGCFGGMIQTMCRSKGFYGVAAPSLSVSLPPGEREAMRQ